MQRQHEEDMERQRQEIARHAEEVVRHKAELAKHNEVRGERIQIGSRKRHQVPGKFFPHDESLSIQYQAPQMTSLLPTHWRKPRKAALNSRALHANLALLCFIWASIL